MKLSRGILSSWRGVLAAAVLGLVVAGCQVSDLPKHMKPLSPKLVAKIDRMNMTKTSPILVRIFKEESELEVWKETREGKYALLETYEICAWSGELGPKKKEGDRQSPEGFYTIYPAQMNPKSSYHLAFNLGFPNAYDQSLGRTGSFLMVHGDCSSRGCYAMEDEQIEEIYALGREAFRGGQRAFQVQAFPFRMTPENMAKHHDNPNMPFWSMLKEGYDHFEVTSQEPQVAVCGHRYVFNAEAPAGQSFRASSACPDYQVPQDIWFAVASKQRRDNELVQQILAQKERREQREEDWEARKARIAGILGRDNDDAAAASPADATAPAAPKATGGETAPAAAPAEDDDAARMMLIASGVPVPEPSPRESSERVVPAPGQQAEDGDEAAKSTALALVPEAANGAIGLGRRAASGTAEKVGDAFSRVNSVMPWK
ncbi:murein L,D-transpeptidase YafK [Amorphus orientalis]|uniref:Murein L,D-transpeptidase YafK n=1 Tax=Amorphus orientalis TaxID=649198 RepID=A0AAE4ASS5_9HYPH|nr:murein L,D-transpeptidase YafK [Amorphus orientalis]